MRKVYLDNLPRMNNKTISWKNSVGFKIKFEYDDIVGELNIIDYKTNGNSPQLYIEYDKNKNWIHTTSLSKAKIQRIIHAPTNIVHKNIKDLSGMKFGKLLVIEDDGSRTNNGSVKWKCICDCGNLTYVTGNKLTSGHTTSCGCKINRYFKPKQSNNKEKRNTAISRIMGRYKSKAKERNIKWDIDRKFFTSIIEQPCYYCGVKSSMNLNINGYSYTYNGVDRIDSDKNYTYDNVVPCCKICNMAKSNMKQLDFYNWVKTISENFTYEKIS